MKVFRQDQSKKRIFFLDALKSSQTIYEDKFSTTVEQPCENTPQKHTEDSLSGNILWSQMHFFFYLPRNTITIKHMAQKKLQHFRILQTL